MPVSALDVWAFGFSRFQGSGSRSGSARVWATPRPATPMAGLIHPFPDFNAVSRGFWYAV